jgi:hypothetical protein
MSYLGLLVVVSAVLALTFANGANDNAKGVATLIGAGRLSTTHALVGGLAGVGLMSGSLRGGEALAAGSPHPETVRLILDRRRHARHLPPPISRTGRARGSVSRRRGSGYCKYLRTVFRLTPSDWAVERMLNPSTRTLCRTTCT